MTQSTEDFEEFARARTPQLYRSAWLLASEHHLAEDLVQISLTNYNAPKEKGDHTRPSPLLTAAQLTQMAHSTQWVFPPRQAADFQPVPDPDDPAAAHAPVPVEQTLARLNKVLPTNLHLSQPKTWTGGFNGASYVVNASSTPRTAKPWFSVEQLLGFAPRCGLEVSRDSAVNQRVLERVAARPVQVRAVLDRLAVVVVRDPRRRQQR